MLRSTGLWGHLRAYYHESRGLRVVIKVVLPIVGSAYLFVCSLQPDTYPLWSGFLATVLVSTGAAVSQLWEEEREADLQALQNDVAQWKDRTGLYARAGITLNELVQRKSDGYVEAVRKGPDSAAIRAVYEERDNPATNVDRIVAVFYDFCSRHYVKDVFSDPGFSVQFFTALSGSELILASCHSKDGDVPRHLVKGSSHVELARDGKSFAAYVWRAGEMDIAPDTEKAAAEGKFASFRADGAPQDEIGSIAGYPVVDPKVGALVGGPLGDGVLGVLCLAAHKKGFLRPEMEDDLSFVFEMFAARIVFEIRREICQKAIVGT